MVSFFDVVSEGLHRCLPPHIISIVYGIPPQLSAVILTIMHGLVLLFVDITTPLFCFFDPNLFSHVTKWLAAIVI